MDDQDSRIASKAKELWVAAGKPDNQPESAFRVEASEIIAIRDSQESTLLPAPKEDDDGLPFGEPIESVLAVQNQGEFPTLTDEGEGLPYPSFDNIEAAKGGGV